MANQSSSHPVLCASFNQDNSCFAIGTRDGFKIFDCDTGRLLYERVVGAFIIVEMLYRSSLLAIVGAGEQPALSPRRLCLFNTISGTPLRELNFLTSILAVRVNRKRLIVVLLDQTYIYDVNSLEIKRIIDTVPNAQGLCAFSANMDNPYVALPASTVKGSVLVYNVMDLQSHSEIHAHRSPLAAMTFSSNGMYIATASEQGTIIRVHLISEATKSYSFRRGTYPSTIFSLSFGPSADLPDILLAASSSGSVHIFSLGFDLNGRSRKSNSFLGSIMPGSVSDALDPAHHLVFHHASAAGVRSDAVIRKIEKASGTSMSEPVSLRATVSVITFSGYFQEYGLRINHRHEATWTLEHEFNLLTAIAEQPES
ncbi:autophagy-related protein 18b [Phtheirospermum japonicum]|uniref:Autophagy-related protein 18b n=1 Tax=Phtheirospermum japonicum TaxID=374723 RepID=A0A830BH37_9LAMI|nr:autophagy-related protein 18b [Phtheirospermum japonicum]